MPMPIPIATELLPYLQAAIAASPSDLVFPRPDGGRMSKRVQLEQVLRRALRRAKILTGYRQTCRREGCGHAELTPDANVRRCPKCKMKLWPVGQVRPLRFHHIRHTTASLLIMAGADLAAVQRIMRHTDPRTTTEFYAHLAPGYLRGAIDRLAINPHGPEAVPQAATLTAAAGTAFAAPLLQGREHRTKALSAEAEKRPRFRCLNQSGREDLNLRHPAPKTAQSESQALPTIGNEREQLDSRLGAQSNAGTNQSPLARNLLHRYFKGSGDGQLNIADVAKRLGVCAATVYKLCATGAVPHVRVINSIRIEEGALKAFIAAQRRGRSAAKTRG
jgi:hypothetical protein